MGQGKSAGAPGVAGDAALADFAALKEDILKVMDSPQWDDGSYAPLLIRLAWHSSGTYCAKDCTGGSNGATMRWGLEANDPENVGLDAARSYLEPLKAKYKDVSYADLWVLAAYCAVEHTGGPKIDFQGGRVDAPANRAIEPGRLPGAETGVDPGMECDSEGRIKGWEKSAEHIRGVFFRMGFNDREIVALITGGHVYGRCHAESSGYAGAWVENPTYFSNEYAADMVGDKWMLVTHDTKMPDGNPVPEEVRPAPGKRQYIDMTKYEPEEDDEEKKNRKAPDCTEYPPGKYACVSQWVNCRQQPDTGSDIIGRFVTDDEVCMVEVKVFGTAIRGHLERGGWVSIIASGGKKLFERKGDLDLQMMEGQYRPVKEVPYFNNAEATTKAGEFRAQSAQIAVSKVELGKDGDKEGAVFGKTEKGYALLYSPSRGLLAEKIVQGYNDKQERQAIKGQTGHQMMLITDMVMLWDEKFRAVLQEYADDDEVLKRDFGTSFKRLTELGCPWSKDAGKAGCPVFCGAS